MLKIPSLALVSLISLSTNGQCDRNTSDLRYSDRPVNRAAITLLRSDSLDILPCDSVGICFYDASLESGLRSSSESWGASWGDWNNDGYPDVFMTNHREPARLCINRGNGTFNWIDLEADWGWDFYDMHSVAWADFDHDFDQDIMVSSGNGVLERLIENRLDNEYHEIAEHTNIDLPDTRGRMPVWFDAENDGDLDLLLCAELNANPNKNSRVFLYNGNIFSQMSSASSLIMRSDESDNMQWAALGDVNSDGQIDLLTGTKRYAPKVISLGAIPFTEIDFPDHTNLSDLSVADFDNDLVNEILIGTQYRGSKCVLLANNLIKYKMEPSFSNDREFRFKCNGSMQLETWWVGSTGQDLFLGRNKVREENLNAYIDQNDPNVWGYNNINLFSEPGIYIGLDTADDTWRIVFRSFPEAGKIAGYIESEAEITELETINFVPENYEDDIRYYVRNDSLGFVDLSDYVGLDQISPYVRSLSVADFDNDMDLDIYVMNGDQIQNTANTFYINNGHGRFTPYLLEGVTGTSEGIAESSVLADYDRDGKMDLLLLNGWSLAFPGGPVQLFRNNTQNTNHWMEIDLRGLRNNSNGIGATVYLYTDTIVQMRMNNSGMKYRSQDHTRLHFGMGPYCSADSVIVRWPDGSRNVFYNLLSDQVVELRDDGVLSTGYFSDSNCNAIVTGSPEIIKFKADIYPNPSSGILNIRLPDEIAAALVREQIIINLSSVSGVEVVNIERGPGVGNNLLLNHELAGLRNGVYIVTIIGEKHYMASELVVIMR